MRHQPQLPSFSARPQAVKTLVHESGVGGGRESTCRSAAGRRQGRRCRLPCGRGHGQRRSRGWPPSGPRPWHAERTSSWWVGGGAGGGGEKKRGDARVAFSGESISNRSAMHTLLHASQCLVHSSIAVRGLSPGPGHPIPARAAFDRFAPTHRSRFNQLAAAPAVCHSIQNI